MVDSVANEDFEAHRSHLIGVAYRMLGSRAEAEDAVQETWLRYAAADPHPDDLRAWLTTVTGRICLDVLRSARVRREAYIGSWLPEPIVTRLPDGAAVTAGTGGMGVRGSATGAGDPAEQVAEREQVSLALLVVLERLTPEQRVAFVLHDVFGVPFEAIASTMDITPAAARQLASRARRAVSAPDVPRHTADLAEQRRVLAAFVAAASRGDLVGLTKVLAPDVVMTGDGAGLAPAVRHPIVGAEQVARFLLGLFRQVPRQEAVYAEPVLVNGDLGLLFDPVERDGTHGFLTLMAFAVDNGRITAFFNQLNPEKLASAPRPDPATATWPPRV
jgi:RNA polymerase sigma-70 factor, ECF subfamily